MGKSNKKIKNDRINTIRKQYDAFLEEDKKRRERNEYILGKLDKMRSSTAVVPIFTKANYQLEPNPSELFMRPNNLISTPEMRNSYVSHVERQNVSSSILNKPMDELRILKQISKNYILIPKRRTPIENNYVYNKEIIDEDWKSKYNILDDLKRLEKEGTSDVVFNENDDNNIHNKQLHLNMESNISNKQPSNFGNDPNHLYKPTLYGNKEIIAENNPDITSVEPNKINKEISFDVPDVSSPNAEDSILSSQISQTLLSSNDGIKVEPTQSVYNAKQEHIINNQQECITEKEKYNSESNEKDINLTQHFNDSSQICETSNMNHPTPYQEDVHSSDYNMSAAETIKLTASENIEDMSNVAVSKQKSDVKPHESCAEETVHQNIESHQKVINKIQDLNSTERVAVYDDVDNPESQIILNATDFDKEQHYDPVQNSLPESFENTQHLEHVEHESEINAFEAEQKEMFYSEQTNADDYAYNQGEGNTGEYTGGYEQEQYAYYEGIQQEQAYPTNIDEHEESTERYDPHYPQQYEGPYENQPDNTLNYENTNEYEQQQFQVENPQFQNIDNYENQQDNANIHQQESFSNENEQQNILPPQDDQMYDQHLYAEQPEAQEHIEQQLLTEEGYIETAPAIPDEFQKENESEIEKVKDVITPVESMPDPK